MCGGQVSRWTARICLPHALNVLMGALDKAALVKEIS